MLHLTKEFNDINEKSQVMARLAFDACQSAFKDDALIIESRYQLLLQGYLELQESMKALRLQVQKYKNPTPIDYEKIEY